MEYRPIGPELVSKKKTILLASTRTLSRKQKKGIVIEVEGRHAEHIRVSSG